MIMRKRVKSLVTAILTASMVLSPATIAMADEQVPEDTARTDVAEEIADGFSAEYSDMASEGENSDEPVGNEEIIAEEGDIPEMDVQGSSGMASLSDYRNTDMIDGFTLFSGTSETGAGVQKVDDSSISISFTQNTKESLYVYANTENSGKIHISNRGTIPISEEGDGDYHQLSIAGFDGHGEEVYVNINMFNITKESLETLASTKCPEQVFTDGGETYIEPCPVLVIYKDGKALARDGYEELENRWGTYMKLEPTLSVVTYDPTGGNNPQTWLKVTFNAIKKETAKEETEPDPFEGYNVTFLDGENLIEVVSQNEFAGKKAKPTVALSYNGVWYYSGKGGQLKVSYKNNKNAGIATVTVKGVKKRKDISAVVRGKVVSFEIVPVTVSDNNLQVLRKKDGTVKGFKVLTGGKYKKVKKSMWSMSGEEATFSGNYKGTVSVNSL